jgi:MATE family multidrug resistance protein
MMPPLWIILGANARNAFLNWVLIFGHLGAPAMGVAGAGTATGITRSMMAAGLALLVFGRGLHRGAWTPWSRAMFDRAGLGRVVAVGAAIAVQIGLEMWAFNASTLVAGRLGATTAAAHIVVLKLASFAFMVPLGVSVAAATRVGNRIGAGDPRGAQRAALVSLALGAGVMCVSALAFLLFPRALAGFFTGSGEVVAVAASIFPIAAAFQIFDGTQAVGSGVLRGMGTPRPAAIFNLVGYYVLALPLGLILAFPAGMGLPGIWIGLSGGLAVVAVLLLAWIVYRGPARAVAVVSESAMSAVE